MGLSLMFPSQLANYPGMWDKVVTLEPSARDILDAASDCLQRDLVAELNTEGAAWFDDNSNLQVAVFLSNCLYAHLLARAGLEAECSLGFSLGECNHLHHIGCIGFADMLAFLVLRGQLYHSRAWDCRRVGIFPMAREDLEPLVAECEGAYIGAYATPRVHLISGLSAAVRTLVKRVRAHDPGVTVRNLKVPFPIHSPIMADFVPDLEFALLGLCGKAQTGPYVSGRTGEICWAPAPAHVARALAQTTECPVDWVGAVDAVRTQFPDTIFVETGARWGLGRLFELDGEWRGQTRYLSLDNSEPGDVNHVERQMDRLIRGTGFEK